MSTGSKTAEIKAKMAQIQKNKTTGHHLRLLKACLAKPHRSLGGADGIPRRAPALGSSRYH
uniref:Uncharacterized protein n=1 Tax=Canis lupus familiaris TaxID=9615 RepID=A0A8I3PFX5_CANLF